MRKIKFRAYLKEDKKMVDVKSIHLGTNKIIYGYSSGQCYGGNRSCLLEDCNLMQCSNFRDQNGTEIYENDTVEFFGEQGQIVFEKGAFGIGFDKEVPWDKIKKARILDCGDDDVFGCFNDNFISLWEISWIFDDSGDVLDQVKVIGNIFDNPEL